MEQDPLHDPVYDGPPLSVLMRQLAVGLAVLLLLVVALAYTLQVPLQVAASWFVERFGLPGVFVAVLLLDAIPFTTHEPILFFGYSGGLGYWSVFLTASTASILSGALGWGIGRLGRRIDWVQRVLLRYRITPFLQRYGIWAVAVAAITPIPYAASTWGAGASGVSLRHVMLGALVRIPKVLIYLSLIAFGWNFGT